MMNFTFKADLTPLDRLDQTLTHVNREVADIGKAVTSEIKPELIDELTDAPPRRNYPADYPDGKLEWTSDPQRKKFWASDGFGGGIPFERDGSVTDAWSVVGKAISNGYQLIIQNTNPGAKFVFGSLAQNVALAARFQQRFHKITGWPLASPIVQEWLKVARVLFEEQWRRRLADAVGIRFSGRAFTSPRRRR